MSAARSIVALALCAFAVPLGAQINTSPIPAPSIVSSTPAVVGFVDLSQLLNGGTQITGLANDSEHNIVTTVGNGLFPAGNVRIGNNGVACAGITSGDISFTNATIPLTYIANLFPPSSWVPTGLPQNVTSAILAFWDDLNPGTGTSIWWKEQNGVLYIMWKDEYHVFSPSGTGITVEIQVFASPAVGAPWIQIFYPDTVFGGAAAGGINNGADATIGILESNSSPAICGNGLWSFNAASVSNGTVLSIKPSTVLTASSPFGPGSIQVRIDRAPPGGTYFVAATLAHGAYPTGWFYGLDIPLPELVAEFSVGAPFVGPINGFGSGSSSGSVIIGPFTGAPSGVTIYAVALGMVPAATIPAIVTQPIAFTIP